MNDFECYKTLYGNLVYKVAEWFKPYWINAREEGWNENAIDSFSAVRVLHSGK